VGGIASGVDRRLEPQFVRLERWRAWFGVALYGGLLFGIGWVFTLGFPLHLTLVYSICAALTVALAILKQWWPGIAYRRASYRADHNGIEIREGVLWRSVTTVPRSRVQHTDVTQGPFERKLGLGTLVLHTAGNAHAVVRVEGLSHADALALREHLLPRNEHDVI
jgi:membrane protein YdbS with pleckstrin-like domain